MDYSAKMGCLHALSKSIYGILSGKPSCGEIFKRKENKGAYVSVCVEKLCEDALVSIPYLGSGVR